MLCGEEVVCDFGGESCQIQDPIFLVPSADENCASADMKGIRFSITNFAIVLASLDEHKSAAFDSSVNTSEIKIPLALVNTATEIVASGELVETRPIDLLTLLKIVFYVYVFVFVCFPAHATITIQCKTALTLHFRTSLSASRSLMQLLSPLLSTRLSFAFRHHHSHRVIRTPV